MNRDLLEQQLSDLPIYIYDFFSPGELEFSPRIRHICRSDCPMYGTSWACPPGVGSVESCRERCLGYDTCLLISSITEVADIADIQETLATRGSHEALTEQVRELLRRQGAEPYVLSTEACALCPRCAYLDEEPCRFPEKMNPCVESHGINIIPQLERLGMEFQYGSSIVTWVSLLLY